MKRIVLVFVALFALSSCVTIVPPTTDPPIDPIEGPQAPGEPEDPLVMEVFCSFNEPFCSRLWSDVVPFVDIDVVLAHYPITSNAYPAALAAECVRGDGFDDYVALLFAEERELTRDVLLELASSDIASCLDSEEHADRVDADIARAQDRGVSAVPTSFISDGENSMMVVGAQPLAEFERAIERARAGEWSFSEVSITSPDEVLLESYGYSEFSYVPITVTGEADWTAWVEETVLFIGDDTAQLPPFDTFAAGSMTHVTPTLVRDGVVSYYTFSFDPAVPLEGFEPQLTVVNSFYEVHEHDGSLVFIRPNRMHSVVEGEPSWVAGTWLSFVSHDEVIVRDDGPTAAMLGFSSGAGSFYRTIALDRAYAIFPGVTVEIDVIDDEMVSLLVSGFGYEVTVDLDIGGSAHVDLGIESFEVTLEGIIVDRDVQIIATLETDSGQFTVGERDMISLGGRTFVVDTIVRAPGSAPSMVRLMESDHIVRISDGFSRWGADGWTSVAGVDARIVLVDGLVTEIVFEQDHSMAGYEDDMLDRFVLSYHWGRQMVSLKDAYARDSVEPQELWYWGREPGTYTIVIEARDRYDRVEPVRKTVEFTVERVEETPVLE